MSEPSPNLDLARKVVATEAKCISEIVDHIDERFAAAAETIYHCTGTVILTGIGKAGIVAQKISATLASTGTPSIYLHPVEALHGDLGRVRRGDVVIILSHSGSTEEIIRAVNYLKARGATLIAMTSLGNNPLAEYSDIVLTYGEVDEACPLGLAPSASTSCMLAMGDALALTVMDMRRFSPEEFAAFHPLGALGRKLMKVEEAMTFRRGERLPVSNENKTVREVLIEAEKIKRRAGAVLLVDDKGKLTGILTDADLRRKMLTDGADFIDKPAREVMHPQPKSIQVGELASKAMAILNQHRIDELPVVDQQGRPVGLLDVQDLVGLKSFWQNHNGKNNADTP